MFRLRPALASVAVTAIAAAIVITMPVTPVAEAAARLFHRRLLHRRLQPVA